jgi:hypothetical protein
MGNDDRNVVDVNGKRVLSRFNRCVRRVMFVP